MRRLRNEWKRHGVGSRVKGKCRIKKKIWKKTQSHAIEIRRVDKKRTKCMNPLFYDPLARFHSYVIIFLVESSPRCRLMSIAWVTWKCSPGTHRNKWQCVAGLYNWRKTFAWPCSFESLSSRVVTRCNLSRRRRMRRTWDDSRRLNRACLGSHRGGKENGSMNIAVSHKVVNLYSLASIVVI